MDSVNAPTFIFGYGSLICADSRARSGHTGVCIAVIATGLRRTWSAEISLNTPEMCPNPAVTGVTAVSVSWTEDLSCECNGVIVQVADEDMAKFDDREKGYTRKVSTDH
jgi:cation transport regulator ChaC